MKYVFNAQTSEKTALKLLIQLSFSTPIIKLQFISKLWS